MSFKFLRGDEFTYLDYKAGQFTVMDLGTKEDPEGPRRCFTLASSPTKQDIMISTRIRDTQFKQKLASLDIGSRVNMESAEGNFILHNDYTKPAIFLSGGIGITPFRSMIKFATDQSLPLKIIMFDSNRNEENILYKEEFDKCLDINKNLKIIYTVTDDNPKNSKTVHDRINKELVSKHLGNDTLKDSIFYICGPPSLLDAMQKLLIEEMYIPEERVKIEEFTGY